MIKTRLTQFQRAHDLLCEVRDLEGTQRNGFVTTSLQRTAPLKALQKLLIREISRAERKVRRTKSYLKMLDSEQDADEESVLTERLEGYRHLAYNWRCFGDAVAFLFMNKFSL